MKLLLKGLLKIIFAFISLSLLLFIPSGTIRFEGACRFFTILFSAMLLTGTYLYFYNKHLLEKRLKSKEKENEQKIVIFFSSIIFISSFVLCGLDFRFSWTSVSKYVVAIGCLIFMATYICFVILLKQNDYLSRTVEIQENQKVVDTGFYGFVRHPMYTIITFMYISIPLIIGSYVGLVPILFIPFVLVKRIKNEEKVLEEGLVGYINYENKVKYRLIPFVW